MGAGKDLNLVVKEEEISRDGEYFLDNLWAAAARQWMATYGNSLVMNHHRRSQSLAMSSSLL